MTIGEDVKNITHCMGNVQDLLDNIDSVFKGFRKEDRDYLKPKLSGIIYHLRQANKDLIIFDRYLNSYKMEKELIGELYKKDW